MKVAFKNFFDNPTHSMSINAFMYAIRGDKLICSHLIKKFIDEIDKDRSLNITGAH